MCSASSRVRRKIVDRKGTVNNVADHLFRLENMEHDKKQQDVNVSFPDEVVLKVTKSVPWYADNDKKQPDVQAIP